MSPSPRPPRVGDQLREELSDLIGRDVHDPGIGFLTITHVKVTSDLQVARVYYTTLGDQKARRESARALERASPFLRRQIGGRLRLKRVPRLEFFYDEEVERADRVARILHDIGAERAAAAPETDAPDQASGTADEHTTDEPKQHDE